MHGFYAEDLAYIHHVGFGGFAADAAPGLLAMLRQAGIHEGLVVDLGCGSGIWARELLRCAITASRYASIAATAPPRCPRSGWPSVHGNPAAAVETRCAEQTTSSGMIPVFVRDLHPGDEPRLLAINRAGAPGVSLLSPDELAELIRLARHFRVAGNRGRIVAYLIAIGGHAAYEGDEFRWFRGCFGDDFLYIDQLAVAPAWRGRGAGRQLYRDLEEAALRSGIARLTCEVNLRPPNPASLRFHDLLGFMEVGTLETGDGRLVSLRARKLCAP